MQVQPQNTIKLLAKLCPHKNVTVGNVLVTSLSPCSHPKLVFSEVLSDITNLLHSLGLDIHTFKVSTKSITQHAICNCYAKCRATMLLYIMNLQQYLRLMRHYVCTHYLYIGLGQNSTRFGMSRIQVRHATLIFRMSFLETLAFNKFCACKIMVEVNRTIEVFMRCVPNVRQVYYFVYYISLLFILLVIISFACHFFIIQMIDTTVTKV